VRKRPNLRHDLRSLSSSVCLGRAQVGRESKCRRRKAVCDIPLSPVIRLNLCLRSLQSDVAIKRTNQCVDVQPTTRWRFCEFLSSCVIFQYLLASAGRVWVGGADRLWQTNWEGWGMAGGSACVIFRHLLSSSVIFCHLSFLPARFRKSVCGESAGGAGSECAGGAGSECAGGER